MISVNLKPPVVEKNKIFLSWEPNFLFKEAGYWIEYLNSTEINASPQALLETYLPACLAFSALGEIEINFPYHFDDHVLAAWKKVFKDTSKKLFRKPLGVKFNNPPIEKVSFIATRGAKTALLFGGGTESLLALSFLLKEEEKPYLVSLWGDDWKGSDLNINKTRLDIEEKLAKEFGLTFIRILTNFRRITEDSKLRDLMKYEIYFLNAALFLPLNLSLFYPIAEQLNISRIYSGNEKENSGDLGFYSLSSEMTSNLKNCGHYVVYISLLEDFRKIDVVKRLHLENRRIAHYQYSCWQSEHQRWCLKCEKCLRNYMIFRLFDIDPASVGMKAGRLMENFHDIEWEVGWEIASNTAVRNEWDMIRRKALELGSIELSTIINTLYRNHFFRRLIIFTRKSRFLKLIPKIFTNFIHA